jgi:S-DNA-T family DNA segregation ATPase FtsK/SpoIIIE
MRRLELLVTIGARTAAVTVDAPEVCTVGRVREAMAAALGIDGSAPLFAGGRTLSDTEDADSAGLRDGAAVGIGVAPATPLPPLAPVELAVVGGAAGGRRVDAPSGTVLTVGRDATSSLRLSDAEVSRRHVAIHLTGERARLADLGSRNGVQVRGFRIAGESDLEAGEVARVGETLLALRPVGTDALRMEPDGTGRLKVNRPPRLRTPDTHHEVVVPTEPTKPKARRFPLIAVLIPIAAAGVMLAVWPGSKLYLIFLVLSPLMLVANAVSDKRGGLRDYAQQVKEYDAKLADVRTRIAALVAEETRAARESLPDPTAVVALATMPGLRLWERRRDDADFLRLRVGIGDLPAALTVRTERNVGPGEAGPEQPVAHDVPVAVDLATDRVLGLAGPRPTVLSLGRAVITHAAALHAPRDLGIVVLTGRSDAPDWEWATWLPHTRPANGSTVDGAARLIGTDAEQAGARLTELASLVDERRESRRNELASAPTGQRWLVVLDGARRLRDLPRLAELLAEGPAQGVHFVCLDEDESALPAECGATAVVRSGGGTRLTVRRGGEGPVHAVLADGLELAAAERLARALAPVDLLGGGDDAADLPTAVRYRDLTGEQTPTSVLAGWRSRPRSTTALLGLLPGGPLVVDLRRDGPHALIAGTSGSGKSELLQTLVASLALGNRPDQLSFVLVDYKGGSAFKDAARLPHCAGLVTDLDEHLVARALESLTAELKRRETVLGAAGAKDIEELWTKEADLPEDARTVLPRLVIVIDEFASLVEEQPDFVKGVVGIGMRGRSLGVHVVLATQRPAGVVTGEIRANVNLRVCLRVTSAGDSSDVLDVPDAARISKHTPGRALLRTGHGELSTFQAARVGWPTDDDEQSRDASLHASRREVTALGAARPVRADSATAEDGRTDLGALVDAINTAAENLGVPAAASPWLPPLPELLTVRDVGPVAGAGDAVADLHPSAVLGRIDRPRLQRQEPFVIDVERTGSLLIAGTVRSGRTTALRTLAAQLADGVSPADLHLYVLDCGNRGLAAVADLPHCGAVVDGDDTEHVERLLGMLGDELEQRRRQLGLSGHSSVAEQRREATDDGLAHVVVLLDRLETFVARYQDHDGGRLIESLEGLLRAGPALGVTFAITTDRTGVSARISSALAQRLVLRQAERDDVAVFGLNPREVPTNLPPGRGVWAATGEVVQVALLDDDASGAAQAEGVRRVATAARLRCDGLPASRLPRRVDPLPEKISVRDLESLRTTAPLRGASAALVAAGGDSLGPIELDLADEGPFVIAGPARSGRSTALLTIVHSLAARPDAAPIVLVTPRPSPLRELLGEPGIAAVLHRGPDLGAELDDLVTEHAGRLTIVVDDAELVGDGPEGAALERIVRNARDTGTVVVAAATTEELLLNRYRGWLATARRSRTGLLLAPGTPTDGEVFDIRLPRGQGRSWPAGRALLVRRGNNSPVQVPMPDDLLVGP